MNTVRRFMSIVLVALMLISTLCCSAVAEAGTCPTCGGELSWHNSSPEYYCVSNEDGTHTKTTEQWEYSYCPKCNVDYSGHPIDVSSVKEKCNYFTKGPGTLDGKPIYTFYCFDCAYICKHEEWTDGVCAMCGASRCEAYGHASVDPETGICPDCGVGCFHHYIEGKCEYCGDVCKHDGEIDRIYELESYNAETHTFVSTSAQCRKCFQEFPTEEYHLTEKHELEDGHCCWDICPYDEATYVAPTATATAEATATPSSTASVQPTLSPEATAAPTATTAPTATAAPVATAEPEATVTPAEIEEIAVEYKEVAADEVVNGVSVANKSEMVATMMTVLEEIQVNQSASSVRIRHAEKVLTVEEKTVMEQLSVNEQMLVILAATGLKDVVDAAVQSDDTLVISEQATALMDDILARVENATEEEKAEFEKLLSEFFPVVTIEIDGVEYDYFAIELEIETDEGVRYERYGFRLDEEGTWIFTSLELGQEIEAE